MMLYSRQSTGFTPARQRPRYPHHHLPLAESPQVNGHADDVVEPGIGALVEQQRGEGGEGVNEQTGLDGSVHRRQHRREFRRLAAAGRGVGWVRVVVVVFLVRRRRVVCIQPGGIVGQPRRRRRRREDG